MSITAAQSAPVVQLPENSVTSDPSRNIEPPHFENSVSLSRRTIGVQSLVEVKYKLRFRRDGTLREFGKLSAVPTAKEVSEFFSPAVEGGTNNKAVTNLAGPDRYKGHPKNKLFVKVLFSKAVDTYDEARALEMMGLLVDTGLVQLKDHKGTLTPPYPAIIMKKKEGVLLLESQEYQAANEAEQRRMKIETVTLICEQAAKDAVQYKVYHDDNKPENAFVTFEKGSVKAVDIFDYGHPDTYEVMKEVDEQKLSELCKTHWVRKYSGS
ncbi:hypothetical protein DFH05DRAFT_1462699 [Lentinula detonsa]|uniref:Protein kinase domain-containing protein n=1 Tax=Lentinula detonsa TaxID=2804962 RepID=A0A9W8NTW1_9AGAR|nr:hypothetical protein DFH05DRAFT_1462699 [Lentinula detonsa]KAJ3980931.1 hypothetical protein F5890DRAFT_1477338 [Lentinula detonsa]